MCIRDRAMYLVTQAKDDPLEYVHHTVGFNYRMPSLSAALGCSQLERIEKHLDAKRRIVSRYVAGLSGVPGISLMPRASWASPAWWLYTCLLYTSDAADDLLCVDLGGRRLIKK